ncbi:MAG: decarboxylase [Tychonema bourrellyi B0820]|uniref:Decarboxylase n=1 Tax=Tychonema bourrellyi FEM_GT703 TaxID=2040638 RepID=A0A2G4EZ41_9CYAN|nr:decarboxylase [Tychonema bourrellyi]MDQ2099913.1 decarboxylase [Tychonema bourrellyi B0820]PHX54793.1 decarboxylase [Tychonema bourrellyi FEM_GT703]
MIESLLNNETKTYSPPCSEAMAQRLLSTYGSPLYVYQADRLHQTLEHITRSIDYPHVQFHFATVTNGNIALLQLIEQAGWGLHANTPGDVFLGLKAGFSGDRIVYTGSNLNRVDIQQLIDWKIDRFNFDSLSQLRDFCEYSGSQGGYRRPEIGLRLNSPELTGDSRIGVHPAEFEKANEIAQQHGFSITGLHFYRGTGTNATAAFTQVIDRLIAIAQQLPDWRTLDFGGGFGYPYRGGAVFDWGEFGAAITERLSALSRPIELVIEPGRSAIAGCGILLAKVVSVKWLSDRQIVGVDTTVSNLSVPAVHGGYRAIATWETGDVSRYQTDICGNTTYSRDYLGRNCWLPKLQIGDAIAILDSGAYGYAMSSHFLHRPRPAEVLIDAKGDRLIRQREDYSILLNGQIF